MAKHTEALVDRLGEALLLHADDLGDEFLFLLELGISGEVLLDHGVADLVKERLLVAEESAVTRGASEQTAKHVALAFVGWHNAVADHEGGAADMVGDHAQRNVALVVSAVLDAGDLRDVLHDVLHGID